MYSTKAWVDFNYLKKAVSWRSVLSQFDVVEWFFEEGFVVVDILNLDGEGGGGWETLWFPIVTGHQNDGDSVLQLAVKLGLSRNFAACRVNTKPVGITTRLWKSKQKKLFTKKPLIFCRFVSLTHNDKQKSWNKSFLGSKKCTLS